MTTSLLVVKNHRRRDMSNFYESQFTGPQIDETLEFAKSIKPRYSTRRWELTESKRIDLFGNIDEAYADVTVEHYKDLDPFTTPVDLFCQIMTEEDEYQEWKSITLFDFFNFHGKAGGFFVGEPSGDLWFPMHEYLSENTARSMVNNIGQYGLSTGLRRIKVTAEGKKQGQESKILPIFDFIIRDINQSTDSAVRSIIADFEYPNEQYTILLSPFRYSKADEWSWFRLSNQEYDFQIDEDNRWETLQIHSTTSSVELPPDLVAEGLVLGTRRELKQLILSNIPQTTTSSPFILRAGCLVAKMVFNTPQTSLGTTVCRFNVNSCQLDTERRVASDPDVPIYFYIDSSGGLSLVSDSLNDPAYSDIFEDYDTERKSLKVDISIAHAQGQMSWW
jgi:hypothetical protein